VVLFAGRIDLSVGAIVSLSTAILAVTSTELGWLSIPLALCAGLACGAFNAVGTILLRINPLIMTLATSAVVKGIALLLLPSPGGEVDYGFYENFYRQDQFMGWPLLAIVAIFAAAFVLFGFTRFGRTIYAAGSDGRAAFANGVNLPAVDLSVFMISGGLAAIAGIAVGIKILSGDPLIGDSFTLDAIAAAVLGGVALQGGRGGVLGVLSL
jgi:ribose transport system permease protein